MTLFDMNIIWRRLALAAVAMVAGTMMSVSMAREAWWMEAEDKASTFTVNDGTIDIIATKGVTLWNNNLMEGNTIIEYEARIVSDPRFKDEKGDIRTSDLNCFWMAERRGGCGGKFVNNYALRLYYMGYGGNWNTTTRFRRYTGYPMTTDSVWLRPVILREYTDKEHLIKPDHWYSIRIEAVDGRVRYIIDGECLVDYVDPRPLTRGYFGFRTTLSHAQMRHFRYSCSNPDTEGVTLRWIGARGKGPQRFGVPFGQGEVRDNRFCLTTDKGEELDHECSTLATWPDGSVKWMAVTTVVPEGTDSCRLTKPLAKRKKETRKDSRRKAGDKETIREDIPFYVTLNHRICPVTSQETEHMGRICTVRRYTGRNFIIRTYSYKGSSERKLVHTLLVDSALNSEGLDELTIHFTVPMHGEDYERYVQFDNNRPMSVQPLIARRKIDLGRMDSATRATIAEIARWDGFRLSQLTPNGYSIRKRTIDSAPWIGTIEGHRSEGRITVGDSIQRTTFRLEDFWQSYPSTLQADRMRTDTAVVSISLYPQEAERYSFAHYDTIPHGLLSAYEDVQPGMSTAWGIARTSTIIINGETDESTQILPTAEYMHRKRAFGIWSLPTRETERDRRVENTLDSIMRFYRTEIERHGWYGFFNYGDIMHAYDRSRDEWRYDVGGYAWDNTELASPTMFWYQFLRTGDPDVWRMAVAMTRHCSEVDTYHTGPHAGLGSRHNVVHWGCGAKESRISEAWWNRFYYYLTADERLGDIMHEVADADTLLYTLDPMRLAQPSSLYPCSAPARLRIGPDWMGYASNWFTEWERNGSRRHYDKLMAGAKSITRLPHGFFQGPMALGYDPATGIISTDMPDEQTTNHLMPIMGGFELMGEMMLSLDCHEFFYRWGQHNSTYKEMAWKIKHNKFRIPRLQAWAAWQGMAPLAQQAWKSLLDNTPLSGKETLWTNDCATWTMDAIFMQETIRSWR